ncbi:MAG: hypothetical protein M1368_04050 [Thaumarchaeota archaeon]|nr:hypothetical protein [Nitrososphaerota archaeon]MDG6995747.1 hypothetical protein [Nitrososphaerota archaeon]
MVTVRADRVTTFSLIAIAISVVLSFSAYYDQQLTGFNPYLTLASLIFWMSILAISFRNLLLGAFESFTDSISRSGKSAGVFVSYISVHLLVYGFILEAIVAAFLPHQYSFPIQYSAVLSSIPIYPPSLLDSIFSMFVYPSIAITIPPMFGLELSLYSISLALIIAVLVTSNVMSAFDLKNVCTLQRRSVAYFALPIIGVVGGASCCLSLPIFIALLAAPVATALASPSIIIAYYVTYFVFPPATAVALKLNLDSMAGLKRKLAAAQFQ